MKSTTMTFTVKTVTCTLIAMVLHVAAENIITTNTGQVRGITESKKGPSIEAFLGVPYAEPPIGDLRFRRPVAKKPWSEVYNASKLPPSCMQSSDGNYFEPSLDSPMSEDCLFLNLWVPHSNDTALKTIMVFIYGGGLATGSTNMKVYDGTNLARKGDVIVASMNYRVGSFGFLFADIDEANGNMGMFDQIMALKWIKANAEAFGGDPNNIVLFGESAGSISVGCHMLSPLSRNLFRRVIMQSGSPVHVLTLDNDNALLSRVSQKIAQLSGCAGDKAQQVVSCLKRLPAENITAAEGMVRKTIRFPFVPRLKDDFLPHDVSHLLSHGHFNDTEVLIGNNEAEGPFFLSAAAPEYFNDGEFAISSKRLATSLMRMVLRMIGSFKGEKEISNYYINSVENGSSASYLDVIGKMIGDYYILCSSYFFAEFASLKTPVFYYLMKFRPNSTPLGEWAKMTHFDDVQYVFGNPLFENFTSEEEAFSDKIMKRWVDFAKTGNPNAPEESDWPRFERDDHKYMVLSKKDSVHSDRPDDGRCEIWREKFETVINEEVLKRFKPINGH